MEAEELFSVASDLLVVAYDSLHDTRKSGLDQVVTVNAPPAGDCCDVLGAWIDEIGPWVPDPQGKIAPGPMPRGPVSWGVVVQLDYLRCVKSADDLGHELDPGVISANTLEIHTDVLAMLRALNAARSNDTLFTNCPTCRMAEQPTVKVLPTSGECGGYRITTRIQLA